ncbi:MAG: monovalent cation/H(+) antiporter subunit G [Opitutales bacterium]|nr:monovalent cation/H(+) antiporter subunit G [Opitutales bacterium]MCH8539292.1 monovalent cation/H(+) antiporter subunit G [Opitutales bacterium]
MLESLLQVIGWVLVGIGLLAMFVGSLGLIRLPDFYTRSHAASMVDTTGIILLLLGLVFLIGFSQAGLKLLVGVIFVILSNPVAIHALARAAFRAGLRPLLGEVADRKHRKLEDKE